MCNSFLSYIAQSICTGYKGVLKKKRFLFCKSFLRLNKTTIQISSFHLVAKEECVKKPNLWIYIYINETGFKKFFLLSPEVWPLWWQLLETNSWHQKELLQLQDSLKIIMKTHVFMQSDIKMASSIIKTELKRVTVTFHNKRIWSSLQQCFLSPSIPINFTEYSWL